MRRSIPNKIRRGGALSSWFAYATGLQVMEAGPPDLGPVFFQTNLICREDHHYESIIYIYIHTYRYILWLYIHICWDSMIGMIHVWSDPLLFLVARCSTTLENMFLFFAVIFNYINMNEKRDEDLEQQNSWAHSQAELDKNGPRICALWDSKAWRWAT